jgi:1-deoxy-D-xylulose-5-phosphate reductoisomerase
VPPEQIEVVVHPQSIVHSLVEFNDTSVLAQLGMPDMRVPIAVALAHPERIPLDVPRLRLSEVARLDFEQPDHEKFPCLGLAFEALAGSEEAPAVLNAANEVSVAAFLDGQISFLRIAETNRAVLDEHLAGRRGAVVDDLSQVIAADGWARSRARATLGLEDRAARSAANAGAAA